MNRILNNSFNSLRGTFIVLSLLCVSLIGNAQEEEYETVIDTVITEEEIPIDERVSIQERENSYFLDNSYYESSDPMAKRNLPDSLVSELQNEDEFWYANKNIQKTEPQPTPSQKFFQKLWESSLLWIIIIVAFVILIIWYLVSNDIRIFRSNSSVIKEGYVDEEHSDNIFQINFEKEIAKALEANDFRMVVRLLFLQSLRKMSEKNLIQYAVDRTNFDYLGQLRQTSYYSDFFKLARNYEYTWYGKFDLSKERFLLLKTDFDNFKNKLA